MLTIDLLEPMHKGCLSVQVRHSNVGDQYTEVVVPRPGDDDIPTTTTIIKPLYGKIRYDHH